MLKDLSGRSLAYGEVIQTFRKELVSCRLVFHFRDGSLDDETTLYSQKGVFRLVRDHHIQKGPSFPQPMDMTIETATGTVTSRSVGKDGKEKVESQHMDLPPDLSNGLVSVIASNLAANDAGTTLAYLSSGSSKPRLVQLAVRAAPAVPMVVAGSHRKAAHFIIHINLGGLSGVIAPMLGKQPDDYDVWIVEGQVPIIVADQGQLYPDGPVWRIELATPSWPASSAKPAQTARK